MGMAEAFSQREEILANGEIALAVTAQGKKMIELVLKDQGCGLRRDGAA